MAYKDRMLSGALGLLFGSFILLFGIDLHNRYNYSTTYDNALHIHLSGTVIMITGAVIVGLSLISVIASLVTRKR